MVKTGAKKPVPAGEPTSGLLKGFAARLKLARAATGMSQRTIADALEVGAPRWNHWEQGRHWPDVLVMCDFCHRYGCSLDYLYLGNPLGLSPDMRLKIFSKPRSE